MAEAAAPRKKKPKVVVERGKRKTAVARATARKGSGIFIYNGEAFSEINDPIVREIVAEPLQFIDPKGLDIEVSAVGGGTMGQAQAARTAIARSIVTLTGDEGIKKKMLESDRTLLVEDFRRVEPKKFKGPKARARFTKSYR